MCVCVCVAERMNVTLGKFERIMEYVNIVLCIRKICSVQLKDLTLYEDVQRGNFIGKFVWVFFSYCKRFGIYFCIRQ